VQRWGPRAALAVADQALYAGAHFLLNLILARALETDDYGAFAVAHSVFLLVGALYGALLLEPMAIYGSNKYGGGARRSYLGVLLRGHVALTFPTAAILVAVTLAAPSASGAVGRAIVAMALALPALLLVWLTRRAFYLESRPAWAMGGSALYFGLLVPALLWSPRLSTDTAFAGMAVAGVAVATVQLLRLGPVWTADERTQPLAIVKAHWTYGRWAVATGLLLWFPLNVYFYVLAASSGLAEAGALKAVLNLANPALHAFIAMGMVLTPVLVRKRHSGGVEALHDVVWRAGVLCLTGSAAYLLLLSMLQAEIVPLLYADRYQPSTAAVAMVALLPIIASAAMILGSALRALEQPKLVFWSHLTFSVTAAAIGIPLAITWGTTGALAGLLISYLSLTAAMATFYARERARACAETDHCD
jgi:O-antigen/teichoic acid export membrane protein